MKFFSILSQYSSEALVKHEAPNNSKMTDNEIESIGSIIFEDGELKFCVEWKVRFYFTNFNKFK